MEFYIMQFETTKTQHFKLLAHKDVNYPSMKIDFYLTKTKIGRSTNLSDNVQLCKSLALQGHLASWRLHHGMAGKVYQVTRTLLIIVQFYMLIYNW